MSAKSLSSSKASWIIEVFPEVSWVNKTCVSSVPWTNSMDILEPLRHLSKSILANFSIYLKVQESTHKHVWAGLSVDSSLPSLPLLCQMWHIWSSSAVTVGLHWSESLRDSLLRESKWVTPLSSAAKTLSVLQGFWETSGISCEGSWPCLD